MKRRLVRRRWLIPLGVLLLPPVFWAVVLSIAPTDWARTRIVARLKAATGRPVGLGSLRIGALGGVRLSNLEIGAPDSSGDPWLRVAEARINVSMLQLLLGRGEPTDIQVVGLTLRVLRRRDGALELSDILQAGSRTPPGGGPASSEPCPIEAAGVEIALRDARIVLIDEPSRTRLELTKVEGRATWLDRHAAVHDLRGTLNDGSFSLVASLDRSGAGPAYEGRFHAEGVALTADMDVLAYLVPVLSGEDVAPGAVDGRLVADVYLRGRGITRDAVRKTLVGEGRVTLDPIRLDSSRLLGELAEIVDLSPQGGVGSIKTAFTIQNGMIRTDDLTLDLAKAPIVLSGWTDFDGRVDYRVRADRLAERLPTRAREMLSDLSVDVEGLSALRIKGTINAMDITVEGVEPDDTTGAPRRAGDPRHLREITRQLRDRLLR